MKSIILHLDMNSYFASCEQQANPQLRGKPVGVCEHLGGIIIAPSVEAKRLGIKLGTTVWDARKICPGIVLLPTDPDKYRHVTAQFLRILMDYTDKVEKTSIDEAFADLTGTGVDYSNALLLALEIKQKLRREVGEWVSCSIGIGPNKLVAKIAADLGEGDCDRVFVVKPEEITRLYDRLQLTDIPGIARRTERALNKLGIYTLKELAHYPLSNLLNQFGLWGYNLHCLANFRESVFFSSSVNETIKSIGHSYTLSETISDLNSIKRLMFKLSEKIGRRMRGKKAWGRIVHYFHSDRQYESFHKQHKFKNLINDGREIYSSAFEIFRSSPRPYAIKIMGISVSGLVFDYRQQVILPHWQKPEILVKAMDVINDKYGEFTIKRGRMLGTNSDWAKDTVGFGRMKEFRMS